MSFIVDGHKESPPHIHVINWLDDPTLPRLARANRSDSRRRTTRWVRGIVLHTTKGIPGGKDRRPQQILPGLGSPSERDYRVARYWASDPTQSGAHLVVDSDGTIVCLADLQLEAAFHAGVVNDVTIGVEIYQGDKAELYADQLAIVVQLCDWLTRRFGIQRQIPDRYRGPLERLEGGGRNVVGVYGHRDVTNNRGLGDPGDAVFERLAVAGYERQNLYAGTDLATWHKRQTELGIAADGIPGPATVAALKGEGYAGGIWVARPGDRAA